jgi:DNA-binding NarL/FixJ family response regulator
MTADVIRLLVADDHALFRSGLRIMLERAPDMSVIGEAESGPEAVAFAARYHPDVVTMDLDMAGGGGLDAIHALVAADASARVLVLTMHTEEERLRAALAAGAKGFLVKTVAVRELLDAVRAVAAGDVYVRASAARALATSYARRAASRTEREQYEQLSAREREVLRLVAQGFSGTEIAQQLDISTKTVVTYRQRIHEKLGLEHRTQYVHLALKLELLAS